MLTTVMQLITNALDINALRGGLCVIEETPSVCEIIEIDTARQRIVVQSKATDQVFELRGSDSVGFGYSHMSNEQFAMYAIKKTVAKQAIENTLIYQRARGLRDELTRLEMQIIAMAHTTPVEQV